MLVACDEAAEPKADVEETSIPDTAPDSSAPDSSAPDTVPDSSAPDTVPDSSAPDSSAPDTQPGDTDVVGPHSLELSLGGWTMQPGEETTRCVVTRLGNTEAIRVNQIRTTLSRGSHHFIVYKSNATEEQATPFACSPFTATLSGQTVPLMISQVGEETLTMPEGVAFELEPNQMVRLEAHYLNYYPDPIQPKATVTFETTNSADTLANFLFYGTMSVRIPAGQALTNPWKFHDVPAGTKVFGLTGHTHALGTNVEIEQTINVETAGTPVYPPADAPFKWDEAPIARFAPPLAFDGDGFRFRCSWNNTTDREVTFGESANKEMCFFWAYYYPSQGFILRF